MRQTQIVRTRRRTRTAEPLPAYVPVVPLADTATAAAMIEAIDALLDQAATG